MITLFTLPKPFKGHIGMIQDNAIGSWRKLRPECQIILMGNEPGIEEAARKWSVEWIPEVARTELGTPLLNSAFSIARERARHDWMCYVNCDIVLFNDLVGLPAKAKTPRTLFVGQRWDYDISAPLDFSLVDWDSRLRADVTSRGKIHPPAGSDYFLFHKDSGLTELPPFAVGRPGWDVWFLYNARKNGFVFVDASPSITVVHQNHDYSHVPQGRGDYNGPEGDANMKIVNEIPYMCTLEDATHQLCNGNIRRALTYKHFRRSMLRWRISLRSKLKPSK